MKTKYITVETEVEVNLSDFDTDDLIEELKSRIDYKTSEDKEILLEKIYILRRLGKNYQNELDEYIYNELGKIV